MPPADRVPMVTPEPNNLIPLQAAPSVRSARVAAAAAAATPAQAEQTAARLAELGAAQARVETVSRAYDGAKLTYASAKAEHDAALARVSLVHDLSAEAARTAEQSHRVVASLIRALAQQHGSDPAIDVLLNGKAGDSLLYQLGALDKLSQLTGNLTAVRERAGADQKRTERLIHQEAIAQQLAVSIRVDTALSDMEAAKADFEEATADLAALKTTPTTTTTTTTVGAIGAIGVTPLPAISDTGQLSAQGWATPAIGPITDVFGPRPDLPIPGVNPFHYATDIGAACGAGIYAATSGVVEAVGPLGTYGNWILINHGDGVETGYAHIATGTTVVGVGESVIAGQVIAEVGSTGASTGCHLHFEVRIKGTRVDPQRFMLDRGVVLGRN